MNRGSTVSKICISPAISVTVHSLSFVLFRRLVICCYLSFSPNCKILMNSVILFTSSTLVSGFYLSFKSISKQFHVMVFNDVLFPRKRLISLRMTFNVTLSLLTLPNCKRQLSNIAAFIYKERVNQLKITDPFDELTNCTLKNLATANSVPVEYIFPPFITAVFHFLNKSEIIPRGSWYQPSIVTFLQIKKWNTFFKQIIVNNCSSFSRSYYYNKNK